MQNNQYEFFNPLNKEHFYFDLFISNFYTFQIFCDNISVQHVGFFLLLQKYTVKYVFT